MLLPLFRMKVRRLALSLSVGWRSENIAVAVVATILHTIMICFEHVVVMKRFPYQNQTDKKVLFSDLPRLHETVAAKLLPYYISVLKKKASSIVGDNSSLKES